MSNAEEKEAIKLMIENAKKAGIKLYFPLGELGVKPEMTTPHFVNIVLDAIWGREVEWMDPVSKKVRKGKVKDFNQCVGILGEYDRETQKPSNPYLLDVVSEGHEYSLNPEQVLFV